MKLANTASAVKASFAGAGVQRAASPLCRGAGAAAHCWGQGAKPIINEIMNTVVTGWKPFSNPRMFAGYGRQKGWERDVSGNELPGNEDGFVELSEEECRQLELPKEWIA